MRAPEQDPVSHGPSRPKGASSAHHDDGRDQATRTLRTMELLIAISNAQIAMETTTGKRQQPLDRLPQSTGGGLARARVSPRTQSNRSSTHHEDRQSHGTDSEGAEAQRGVSENEDPDGRWSRREPYDMVSGQGAVDPGNWRATANAESNQHTAGSVSAPSSAWPPPTIPRPEITEQDHDSGGTNGSSVEADDWPSPSGGAQGARASSTAYQQRNHPAPTHQDQTCQHETEPSSSTDRPNDWVKDPSVGAQGQLREEMLTGQFTNNRLHCCLNSCVWAHMWCCTFLPQPEKAWGLLFAVYQEMRSRGLKTIGLPDIPAIRKCLRDWYAAHSVNQQQDGAEYVNVYIYTYRNMYDL